MIRISWLAALFACTLLLGGCDASDPEDPPTESLTGRWVATATFDHDRTWPLPEWASEDSVRYTYIGTQIFTLTLDDQSGTVSGRLDLDEAGTLTVTTYRDGAITNQTPGPILADETEVIRATYQAPTLTFERFNNAGLSTRLETDGNQLRNFVVTFTEGAGQAAYTYRMIETRLTGPEGQIITVGVTLPVSLVFERMPGAGTTIHRL